MTPTTTLTPEDLALIERVATRVVELRMEVPAILALETATPVTVIAGQAMLFLEPFVAAMFRMPDYRRFAKLAERRDALEALMRRIELLSAAAHERRRTEAAARRSARAPSTPRS